MGHTLPSPEGDRLPLASSVLAVCAHPDDESFGLGATLAAFGAAGAVTSVLCFSAGEASTLGARDGDLAEVRAGELAAAAEELGVDHVELLHYRDGHLSEVALAELSEHVERAVARSSADLVLVFDEGGITGHADHRRASEAALAVAPTLAVPVLAWALTEEVADTLRGEFGGGFAGRPTRDLDLVVRVDRRRQLRAIARHATQATDNPVLGRRLELQGDHEVFRWLVAPSETSERSPDAEEDAVTPRPRRRAGRFG